MSASDNRAVGSKADWAALPLPSELVALTQVWGGLHKREGGSAKLAYLRMIDCIDLASPRPQLYKCGLTVEPVTYSELMAHPEHFRFLWRGDALGAARAREFNQVTVLEYLRMTADRSNARPDEPRLWLERHLFLKRAHVPAVFGLDAQCIAPVLPLQSNLDGRFVSKLADASEVLRRLQQLRQQGHRAPVKATANEFGISTRTVARHVRQAAGLPSALQGPNARPPVSPFAGLAGDAVKLPRRLA